MGKDLKGRGLGIGICQKEDGKISADTQTNMEDEFKKFFQNSRNVESGW